MPVASLRPLSRLAAVAVLALSSTAFARPALAPIWGDNAVIQRDRTIVVEGFAAPGEAVRVTLGGETGTAIAQKDGRFAIRLAPRRATAEPLALTLAGADGEVQRLSGLVVGDVWLCSGQSNMEMTQERALNSWNAAQESADSGLRMITVPKAVSDHPLRQFGGPVAWAAATPQTVPAFSAACYYMARNLRRTLGVPIGAIHASWGGSASRPWLTPQAGKAIYGAAEMALLSRYATDPAGAVAQFAPAWEQWYASVSGGSQPWLHPEASAWLPVPASGAWNGWQGTPLAEKPVGTVWFHRSVVLDAAQAAAATQLDLGVIDDMDMTWVNGRAVGNVYDPARERHYRLPAGVLHAGINEIVIAVTNTWGPGGMISAPERLALVGGDGVRVPLGGGWRYAIAPITAVPPRTPWDNQAGIGVMANAMIAPIGAFPLAGVAWYQGESDVGNPGYAGRLAALFAGWREQFGAPARMLVVVLAGFGAPQLAPAASATAELREAQRQGVLADRNAALVTAIDLGERTDIHPANKVELGRRLALAATGEALPQPQSATREGGIRVRFSGVNGALAAWSSPGPIGFELCGLEQSSCRYATARIDGADVVLADDGKPASRVRFGWADTPVINLYDARPLPVPPFELPITAK